MPDGTLCRHYTVRFSLTKLPPMLESANGTVCRYQNLLSTAAVPANTAVQSVDSALVGALPEIAAYCPPAQPVVVS